LGKCFRAWPAGIPIRAAIKVYKIMMAMTSKIPNRIPNPITFPVLPFT